MWRLYAAGALVVVLGLGAWHYMALRAEAAKVPQLEATLADADRRVLAAAERMQELEDARIKAEEDLTTWQTAKDEIIRTVRLEGRRASASVNPVCAPSADDRRVRNDALARLVADPVGEPANLSGSAREDDGAP